MFYEEVALIRGKKSRRGLMLNHIAQIALLWWLVVATMQLTKHHFLTMENLGKQKLKTMIACGALTARKHTTFNNDVGSSMKNLQAESGD